MYVRYLKIRSKHTRLKTTLILTGQHKFAQVLWCRNKMNVLFSMLYVWDLFQNASFFFPPPPPPTPVPFLLLLFFFIINILYKEFHVHNAFLLLLLLLLLSLDWFYVDVRSLGHNNIVMFLRQLLLLLLLLLFLFGFGLVCCFFCVGFFFLRIFLSFFFPWDCRI